MVADQPLEAMTLATAVGYPVDEVTDALAALAAEYTEQGRGFELRNVGGGWRYYTRDEYAAVVEGFVLEGQQARLTQAALETLAVVAYKQPVSRARVSAIRGVNVDGVMRTLLSRGLVEEAGQDHETGANLYRTTGYFLERIGVTSLDELPELAPYLPDMDDLEDELAEMVSHAGRQRAGAPEAAARAPALAAQRRRHRARRRDRTVMSVARDRRRRADPAAEAAGDVERRLAPQVRGADARRAVVVDGEVVTRLGTKVDPRTAVIRVDGKRLPPISEKVYLALNKPRGVVSTMSDPEGRRDLSGPGRRPARAALPRRPARHRHRRADHPHQRRRLRPAAGAPVVRGGQDLRRRGRRRGLPPHARSSCSRASPSTTARSRSARRGSSRPARTSRSSSW